jgi:hypothetical protein
VGGDFSSVVSIRVPVNMVPYAWSLMPDFAKS